MRNRSTEVQSALAAADRALRGGDQAAARARLDDVLAIEPGHPVALNARGTLALGDQRFGDAAADFAAAAQADPDQPVLWVNLATAHRGAGDDEAERAALERALAKDRFHFTALLRKAELEERAGPVRDAVLAWNAVISVASGMAERPPAVEEALRRGQAFMAAHGEDLARRYDEAFGADRAGDPDMRRFNRCLDHVLGRAPIFRNECQGVHYPFLPADEFFDKRLFPWLGAVEAQTAAIREEARALIADPGEALRPYVKLDEGTPQNKWSALDNSLEWGACFLWEYGRPNPAVLDRCPATAAALRAAPDTTIPGKAPSAFFSILKAGAHIPPHTGVTNTRAIVHLPLIVPEGCRFRVGGETREWVEGEAFAFDDTIEHEAINESAVDRVVLIFDTWNPHLTAREQQLLREFYAMQEG